jgi:hypothetical protein
MNGHPFFLNAYNDWDKFIAPKYIIKMITSTETRSIPPLKMKRDTYEGTNGHDDQKEPNYQKKNEQQCDQLSTH